MNITSLQRTYEKLRRCLNHFSVLSKVLCSKVYRVELGEDRSIVKNHSFVSNAFVFTSPKHFFKAVHVMLEQEWEMPCLRLPVVKAKNNAVFSCTGAGWAQPTQSCGTGPSGGSQGGTRVALGWHCWECSLSALPGRVYL